METIVSGARPTGRLHLGHLHGALKNWVRLQDSGSNGNGAPLTEGASLVLVYRHPAYSFKSIVIFDGAQTMDNHDDLMSLDLYGFYQASGAEQKITHIVGNGQAKFGEILMFNGQTLATDPFSNGWDDATYNVSGLMSYPQFLQVLHYPAGRL